MRKKHRDCHNLVADHGAFYLSYFFNSSSHQKNISFHSGASLKISSSISLIWFNPT